MREKEAVWRSSDLHFLLLPVGFSDVAPKYLAEGRDRHPVPEINSLWNLEAGQKRLAVRNELGFADGTAGLQRHVSHHDIAPLRIGSADHRRHFDRAVPVKNLLDIVREYVLATTDDHVLLAIDDIEVAFLVEATHVSQGKEPAFSGLRRRLRIVVIFPDDGRAADMDFADLAVRNDI